MNLLFAYTYREDDLAGLPLSELAAFTLESEELPAATEVSVSFVDNDEIARLNAEFRHKAGPTDVLSFECDLDEDEDDPAFASGPIVELGDVIIAPDVAEAQTALYGTTFEQEISLLLVHGLLHLCGYDHVEDGEARIMQARERDILGEWFARRGMDAEAQAEPIAYEPFSVAARVTAESALPKTPEER